MDYVVIYHQIPYGYLNMKPLSVFLIASALGILPVHAENATFFKKSVPNTGWSVFGNKAVDSKDPACWAQVRWKDGSEFQFALNLKQKEFRIIIENVNWQIDEEPGQYSGLHVNLYDSKNNIIDGYDFGFYLVDKKTINVGLNKSFVINFLKASKVIFVMPGNVKNITVTLQGQVPMMNILGECSAMSNKLGVNDDVF